jgi:hypothetical protein
MTSRLETAIYKCCIAKSDDDSMLRRNDSLPQERIGRAAKGSGA